ncbi:MAG: GntR family transcriptional regulator [Actinobacteria bacterium]|nr:GntR family transcriptional regulator [Actinomycetota bacterium]
MEDNIRIEKDKPIPLYYQIEEILRKKIMLGEIKPGELIPTEKKLEEMFGVSRITIRQAISNLARDGLVEAKRASGTFVKKVRFDQPVLGITSYTDKAIQQGYIPSSKVLNFEKVKPIEEIKKELKLSDEDYVYEVKRLRLLNDEPTGVDTTYIPVKLVPKLSREDFKETGKEQSLYYILENKYHLVFNEAEELIDATATNKEESVLLGLKINSPVNLRTRVVFLTDGTSLCYTKSVFKNRYKIRLKGRIK